MSTAKYRLLVLGYCIMILSASSIPIENITNLKLTGWDKLLHVLEYSILGWLLLHALLGGQWTVFSMAIAGGMLFGAFDETWQKFLVYRSASFLDWAADSAGVALGVVTGRVLMARREGP
ncbi:MAG: VanZ family protein [Candidatus Neomarinimicrobiota bacterium]